MTRRTATWRAFLAAIIVAGCAGPEPSGSSEGSLAAEASPSAMPSPTMASPTSFPSPEMTAAPSTVEPTIEPEPTPDAVSAPRIEIEINHNVVDRPGVPASLRDKYWWAGSDVGLVGTTAQLGVPRGEWVIHAADGLVLTERSRPDGERGTELVIRRFKTGSIVAEVQTSMRTVNARLVGGRLFWTGMRDAVACPSDFIDGGVWGLDLGQSGSEPVAIVEPGQHVACGFVGRRVTASSSGAILGGVMSSYGDPNWIDVIDVASMTRLHRISDAWPHAISDDSFIQWDQRPTDGIAAGLGGMTSYDLASGAKRWTFPDKSDVKHFGPSQFMAFGSQFVVEYVWWKSRDDIEVILSTFDPRSGEQHELLRQRDTREEDDIARAQAAQSTASHLTLAFDSESGWYGAAPRVFSVLDVETGEVTWDAYTIDPPWLCAGDRCFRDG